MKITRIRICKCVIQIIFSAAGAVHLPALPFNFYESSLRIVSSAQFPIGRFLLFSPYRIDELRVRYSLVQACQFLDS